MQLVARYIAALLLIVAIIIAAYQPSDDILYGQSEDFGFQPDRSGTAKFLAELDQPYFRQAGADILKNAKGKDTFLWRQADVCHRQVYGRKFTVWRQGIGDCVSFGYAMGCYVVLCVQHVEGIVPEPPLLVATEPLYGGARCEARGVEFAGFSDGATASGATRWISGLRNGTGGVLFREKYRDLDFTTYSPEVAKNFGAYGCGGRGNEWLDKEANKRVAHGVALVTTFEECAASIESGFPVAICSSIGFDSRRDKDGFSRRKGRWLHCQVCLGVRYAKNEGKRDGILICNSWGENWIGPRENVWPEDMPQGCYWATREDISAILAQGESFAIAGVNGFEWQDLDHGEWIANQ